VKKKKGKEVEGGNNSGSESCDGDRDLGIP
jgi:hypothetical protein